MQTWLKYASGVRIGLRAIHTPSHKTFSELTDITQRMKDLATQAANGTNNTTDSGTPSSQAMMGMGISLKG